MPAQGLAHAATQTIARHGIAKRFLDTESEARLRQLIGTEENREVRTGAAFSSPINGVEIAAPHEPRFAGK